MYLKIFTFFSIFLFFEVNSSASVCELDPLIQKQSNNSDRNTETIDTLFVSPSGSNKNNGSESDPYLTLAYAASKSNPGDIVILENGIYTCTTGNYLATLSKSGTSTAYITFKARNKGGAILDGQNNSAIAAFYINGSYINISGFEIRDFSSSAIDVYAPSNYTFF